MPVSGAEEDRKRAQRAEQVALFRYQLIREAADPGLSVRQRGRMVREIAGREHAGPFGEPVTVSRATADRWIRAWRSGGFAALAPPARQVTARTDPEVLELAAGLKRENPERTAAQVERILRKSCGWAPAVAASRPAYTPIWGIHVTGVGSGAWSSGGPARTIRGLRASSRPGSAPTRTAWTTWSGCAGRAGSPARPAVMRAAGGWAMAGSSAPPATGARRRRRARSSTGRARRRRCGSRPAGRSPPRRAASRRRGRSR